MKDAVAILYAEVTSFLIRAHGWYRENKLLHALHAITQPSELRYSDLLKKISCHSQKITALAMAGSQAELRDMHNGQKQMSAKIDNV
jgi:hypothetical protein